MPLSRSSNNSFSNSIRKSSLNLSAANIKVKSAILTKTRKRIENGKHHLFWLEKPFPSFSSHSNHWFFLTNGKPSSTLIVIIYLERNKKSFKCNENLTELVK